jgi:hypothetical protein
MNKDKIGLGAISYLIHVFFSEVMPKHTFIFHTDRPRELHKDMLKGKVPSIPDYTTINIEE